jgi:hypothetical protein
MTALLRLLAFEFSLVRILFFRVIFERLMNTMTATVAGFGAVYYYAFAQHGIFNITPTPENISYTQCMVLFSFLYAETIMANWQYTTNKTGRMELIFNSTQPPLLVIFFKNFASASFSLVSITLLYTIAAAWFGLLGTFNFGFLLVAIPTLFVCCCIMCFNAVFEFQLKQVKAVTAMFNLMLPYFAIRNAEQLSKAFDVIPYFGAARFIRTENNYGWQDVAWLYTCSAITALFFLLLAQLLVRRIRSKASVYLE